MKYLPAVFIGAILPLIYVTVFAVIGIMPTAVVFNDDIITMVVTAVVSGTLGGVTGYAVGSSNGSAKKDDITLAK